MSPGPGRRQGRGGATAAWFLDQGAAAWQRRRPGRDRRRRPRRGAAAAAGVRDATTARTACVQRRLEHGFGDDQVVEIEEQRARPWYPDPTTEPAARLDRDVGAGRAGRGRHRRAARVSLATRAWRRLPGQRDGHTPRCPPGTQLESPRQPNHNGDQARAWRPPPTRSPGGRARSRPAVRRRSSAVGSLLADSVDGLGQRAVGERPGQRGARGHRGSPRFRRQEIIAASCSRALPTIADDTLTAVRAADLLVLFVDKTAADHLGWCAMNRSRWIQGGSARLCTPHKPGLWGGL